MKYTLLFLAYVFSQTTSCWAQQTVIQRLEPPVGYQRQAVPANSFGYSLQNFALAPVGTQVKYFDGTLSPLNEQAAAVLDLSVGKRDLQQCADAIMRLHSEFMWQQNKAQDVSFLAWSGQKMDWTRYLQGYRYGQKGYKLTAKPLPSTHEHFLKYLEMVFTYASTVTLEKELEWVGDMRQLKAGDVLIKGGTPGHAFVVMNVAVNKQKKVVYLVAQSFMPAQNVHIIKHSGGAWFEADKDYSNEIAFGHLLQSKYHRRFKD